MNYAEVFSTSFQKFLSLIFFCSNDSIKKRRNMPSIKNKRHDISFMARAHSEWHGVIWKPQISIFLKEADRRTLLLPILIITQCFHINVLELSFLITVLLGYIVFLPIKHFWFLFENLFQVQQHMARDYHYILMGLEVVQYDGGYAIILQTRVNNGSI